MVDLKQLQKDVYQNKIDKGFNVTDAPKDFNYLIGEVAEAIEAYYLKKEDLGEELADIVIYILGLAEMLGYSLEDELLNKFEKIKAREYVTENGILRRTK